LPRFLYSSNLAGFILLLGQRSDETIACRAALGLTLLCLGLTVFFGCNVLYMLPGCAQRRPFPNEDIYSLHNLRQTLGFWVNRFWWAFLASVLSILTFYASTMGADFFWLAILADFIVLATIVFPMIRNWLHRRNERKMPVDGIRDPNSKNHAK
jgi:hypothetical protein